MARRKPQRTCVGCKQVTTKRELIRVVRTPEGAVEIDATGKQAGRGAYVCANRECWKKALAQKQLNRALKITLSKEDTDRLTAFAESLPDLDADIQGDGGLIQDQEQGLADARKESVEKSRSSLKGQIAEQMAPLLPE